MQIAKDCLENIKHMRRLQQDIEDKYTQVVDGLKQLGYEIFVTHGFESIETWNNHKAVVKIFRQGKPDDCVMVAKDSLAEAVCLAVIKAVNKWDA